MKQPSLRSPYSYFDRRILTFARRNWKFHAIIVIKTDLSGFVVTMHSGLCKQYVKSLGVSASEFDFLFHTYPRALWQQIPPEPVLITLLSIQDAKWHSRWECLLQPPCTFSDVIGIQLSFNSMCELLSSYVHGGFRFLLEIMLLNFWHIGNNEPTSR